MNTIITYAGIRTRYCGPTAHFGSRIIAKSQAGSLTFGYDHALTTEANHQQAAEALADRLGWGKVKSGCQFDGDYYWVTGGAE